jgi:hypothetical protein
MRHAARRPPTTAGLITNTSATPRADPRPPPA